MSWSFQNGRHAHPAGGADGDQAAPMSLLLQQLSQGADNASACCGEWMADGEGAALDVHAAAVDSPQGGRAPENVAAIILAFPGLERAQNLCGKGFVDFIEVEVLQGQVRDLQQLTDRDGGSQQQAVTGYEVDSRTACLGQPRQYRQVVGGDIVFTGQKHGGGAIGQRRAVARGQGAGSAAIEGGFEGGEFLHAAVGSQVVVPGDAVVAEDEIVEESFGIGGGTLEMAFEGQLVLLLTGDVPFPGRSEEHT